MRTAMAIVGLVQTLLVAALILSSGFQQDDYLFFYLGRHGGMNVTTLTHSVFGSLIPGFMFVNTLVGEGTPVHRWELVAITLALYVALIVVMYRLLELLFGPRPFIVLLTAIATCSGLLGVSLVWWTPAINTLPALVADLLALDGLARHARTGRRRYLVVSVVSFAVGVAFYDPSMEVVVPLILFVLLYLSDVRDLTSLWNAIRARAWLWLGYAVPIVMSLTWRWTHPSQYKEPPIANAFQLSQFVFGGWIKGFVSSAIGVNYSPTGGWWWEAALAEIALVGLVIFTVVRRRSAWRAWAFFFVSFAVTDLVAAIGRASLAGYFQTNSIYWSFSIFLLMISIGLALFPTRLPRTGIVEPPINRRFEILARAKETRLVFVPAVALAAALCAAGFHFMWTTQDRAHGASNRVYLDHVQAAWSRVSAHQPRSFVWDTVVPPYVMLSWFAPYNRIDTSVALVVGHLRVDSLTGIGYVIDGSGNLVRADPKVISQVTSSAGPAANGVCLDQPLGQTSTVQLPLTTPLQEGSDFVKVRYTRSSGMSVTPYGHGQAIQIPQGNGTILVPLTVPSRSAVLPLALPKGGSACLNVQIERLVEP